MTADPLFGASEFLPARGDNGGEGTPRSSSRDGTSLRRMMLFAGRSSIDLAERIADELGVSLGGVDAQDVPEHRDRTCASTSRCAAPTCSSSSRCSRPSTTT